MQMGLSGALLHTATQLAHMGCPWPERWQRLLSILVPNALWVLPLCAPRFFLRRRHWVVGLFTLVFYSFPLLRQPKGIQRAMDASATPGPAGFLLDILKMIWGESPPAPRCRS